MVKGPIEDWKPSIITEAGGTPGAREDLGPPSQMVLNSQIKKLEDEWYAKVEILGSNCINVKKIEHFLLAADTMLLAVHELEFNSWNEKLTKWHLLSFLLEDSATFRVFIIKNILKL